MISNPAGSALPRTPSAPRVAGALDFPQLFGGYQLLEKWGDGPIGEVYHALQLHSHQSVSLKRIHPPIARDPGFARNFLQAAGRARRLSHPILPEIVEVGEQHGQLFVATLVPHGRPLTQLLAYLRASGVGLEPSIAAELIRQLAEALAHAHSARSGDGSTAWPLIHGNLKPSNVLILPSGEVRLLDLGTSVAASLNPEGPLVWLSRESLRFMAPELTRGADPDSRSDVYALGLLFFELLTLEPVIEPSLPLEMLRQVGEVDLLERLKVLKVHGVSPELVRVLQGALQRRPRARFPDAGALAAALSAALHQLASGTSLPMPAPALVWTELLRELVRKEGLTQRETLDSRLARGDDEASLAPWDLTWFEDAMTSSRGWRQAHESSLLDAQRVVPASSPPASSDVAPVTGIMLLDDDAELEDDWEAGLSDVPFLAARASAPAAPLEISGDELAYEAGEPGVVASSPLILQAEELEDSSVPGEDELEASDGLASSPIPLGVDAEDFGRALQALENQGIVHLVDEEPAHVELSDELEQLRRDDDEERHRSRRSRIVELGVSEESHRTVFIPDSASLFRTVEEVSGADVLVASDEELDEVMATEAAEDETDPSEVTDRRQEASAEAAEQAVRAVEAGEAAPSLERDLTPAESTDKFAAAEGFDSLHHEVTNPMGIAAVPAFDAPAGGVSAQALVEVSQALRASELEAATRAESTSVGGTNAAGELGAEGLTDDLMGPDSPREGGRKRSGDARRTNTRRTRNSGIVATTDSVTGSGVVATTGIEVRSGGSRRGGTARTTSPALGRPGEAAERSNSPSGGAPGAGEAGLPLESVSDAFATLEERTDSSPPPAAIAFAETTAESLFFGSSLFVPSAAKQPGTERSAENREPLKPEQSLAQSPSTTEPPFSAFSSELVPTEEILGQSMAVAVAELQRSAGGNPSGPLALHTLEAPSSAAAAPPAPTPDVAAWLATRDDLSPEEAAFDAGALEDATLDEPALGEPALGEPALGEPALGEPALGELPSDDFAQNGPSVHASAETDVEFASTASSVEGFKEAPASDPASVEFVNTSHSAFEAAGEQPAVVEVFSKTPPRVPGLFSDLPTETFFNQVLPDSSPGLISLEGVGTLDAGFELGVGAPPTESVVRSELAESGEADYFSAELDPSELPPDDESARFTDLIPDRAMKLSAGMREPVSGGHSPYPVRSHETTVEISIVDDGAFEEEVEGEVEALSYSDTSIPDLMGPPISRVDLATEQAKADGRFEEIPETLQLGEEADEQAPALEIETVGVEEVIEVGDSSELDEEEEVAAAEAAEEPAEMEAEPMPSFLERSLGTGSRGEAVLTSALRGESESQTSEPGGLDSSSSGSVVITNPFVSSSSSRSGTVRIPGERISSWEGGGGSSATVNLAGSSRLEPGARISVPAARATSSQPWGSNTASPASSVGAGSAPRAPAWLRPVSRRPSLRDGALVAGRYRVEGLLMEFPERSIYAVTELVHGAHRQCYVCGFTGNEAEDNFCQKCGSSLLDRQLTLSMRWDKRRVERDGLLLGRELQHPGVARIYDQFVDGGRLYRVLDLVTADISAGVLLSQLAGPLEIPMLGEIGVQASIALHALHEQGINSPFLSEDHLFLRSELVQLFDLDLDEVVAPGALSASMRIKDVMVLARVLVQYMPSSSTELVDVLRAATEGRIPTAEDFAIAIHEAAGLPDSSLFPAG